MLPLRSNTLEPQESLACQGKQKSLHTHNFLKIVSSNLASGLVFLLLFVFSYPLCSALFGEQLPHRAVFCFRTVQQ